MANNEPQPQRNLIVNAGTVIGSTYSQTARVTISDTELTIEFAYVHPADPTQGQSVARVTMPVKAGTDLAKTILQLEIIHGKRKEGKKDD